MLDTLFHMVYGESAGRGTVFLPLHLGQFAIAALFTKETLEFSFLKNI